MFLKYNRSVDKIQNAFYRMRRRESRAILICTTIGLSISIYLTVSNPSFIRYGKNDNRFVFLSLRRHPKGCLCITKKAPLRVRFS